MNRLPDLAAAFDESPNPYMILDRGLRLVAANRSYVGAVGRSREELLGMQIFDAFPHDPHDVNNASRRLMAASFARVLATRRADVVPFVHYRIAIGGGYADRFWSATHTPLMGPDGDVAFILQHAVDVTELQSLRESVRDLSDEAGVLARAEQVQERNLALDQELTTAHEERAEVDRRVAWLRTAFMQAPVALVLLRGADYVVELVNTRTCEMWRRTSAQCLDRRLIDVLPELAGQGLFELLDGVRSTGEPHVGTELPVGLERKGVLVDTYFTFVYQPVFDHAGAVESVLVVASDVTSEVLARNGAAAARAEVEAAFRAEHRSRAEAEHASQVKDQFLATVSHELRTPMTAILGWVQMLRGGMLAPDKRERALETIERNARAQTRLVDDLLDVSRIVSGKLALDLEVVEIAGAVAAAVDTVRPAAAARGVAIELRLGATAPVMGDARRLQQVLWNLLSNAVKFTPRGGHVVLSVDLRDDWVEIAVADDGAGMAPEFLPSAFDRFRQAATGDARSAGGLGLGLSIVRHVIDAHRGEVRAYSDGLGKGSCFVVRIPASMPVEAPPTAVSTDPLAATASLAGVHVLVVDDQEDTREFVRSLLEQCDARVTVAASASGALTAIEFERFAVIISDLGMPEVDGLELLRRVRALPDARRRATPAIALTAFVRAGDRACALLAGFDDHLTKPVDPMALLAAVASLASRG